MLRSIRRPALCSLSGGGCRVGANIEVKSGSFTFNVDERHALAASGFTFEGWKMEGTDNIYSADRVKDLEINKDTTFVASLKKKAEPAKPDDKKPEPAKPATPAKPAAPVTPNVDKAGRSPLLIKSSKTINFIL